MHESLFDIDDPASLHGLQLRRRFGKGVTASDLITVIEANTGLAPDAEFRKLLLDVLSGKTGPKRGRRPKPPGHIAQLMLAEMQIEDLAEQIREERKARPAGERRVRGERAPVEQAAHEVAQRRNMTGKSLLNEISSMKMRLDFS
ncbi:hypothetical protein L7H23_08900 [Sphingopyxis sp. BSN-002]|uniref:hypothetical protein n=1 Tax=Sphingopyxis sp. BSN-002 TaxID=2911495 RepID=UPI001EDA3905|nr:hypothetical protein [Sphingopyxis sp. BSN-002]UKK86195.1 hypothetical protein L7H23_08900 [Sphingopyxis sp. BSN-002]